MGLAPLQIELETSNKSALYKYEHSSGYEKRQINWQTSFIKLQEKFGVISKVKVTLGQEAADGGRATRESEHLVEKQSLQKWNKQRGSTLLNQNKFREWNHQTLRTQLEWNVSPE